MEDFSETVRRAREGEPDAVEDLYRSHVRGILAAVRKRLGGPLRRRYDTLDLGHSVFIEVVRDLPRFEDRGEAAFRRWIGIKAESKVCAKLRKLLRPGGGLREEVLSGSTGSTITSPAPSPVQGAIRNEESGEIRAVLRRLEPRYRRVIELRNDEALTYAEVATWMDLPSEDAARKLYVRALLRARKLLGRS